MCKVAVIGYGVVGSGNGRAFYEKPRIYLKKGRQGM